MSPASSSPGRRIIPGAFLETILTRLRRSNIVRSRRGPDGGFWLARPASEISLAEIIRAIDDQLLGVRGEPPEDVSYSGPAEPLRRVWIALRAFGPTVLETVTLADIVSGELWLPGVPRSSGVIFRTPTDAQPPNNCVCAEPRPLLK